MDSFSSRLAVLGSTELLELILLQLDLRSLLHAQRVCLRWRDVCQSAALQRALFFRPAKAGSEAVVNPLLMLYFPAWFAPKKLWKERYQIDKESWARDAVLRERFLRPEASWKAMLPIQPQPDSLRVVLRAFSDHERVRKGEILLNGKWRATAGQALTTDPVGSRKRKRRRAEVEVHWNGRDVNMGLIYHLAQTYVRARVVSHFSVAYPEEAQRVLDAELESKIPSRYGDLPASRPFSYVAERFTKPDKPGSNALTMVFEQVQNWFEPQDRTGDWLEKQNARFARLSLRGWAGPVIWDETAIRWHAQED